MTTVLAVWPWWLETAEARRPGARTGRISLDRGPVRFRRNSAWHRGDGHCALPSGSVATPEQGLTCGCTSFELVMVSMGRQFCGDLGTRRAVAQLG